MRFSYYAPVVPARCSTCLRTRRRGSRRRPVRQPPCCACVIRRAAWRSRTATRPSAMQRSPRNAACRMGVQLAKTMSIVLHDPTLSATKRGIDEAVTPPWIAAFGRAIRTPDARRQPGGWPSPTAPSVVVRSAFSSGVLCPTTTNHTTLLFGLMGVTHGRQPSRAPSPPFGYLVRS